MESSSANDFSISLADSPAGDGVVITIYGELDVATASGLKQQLERALDAEGPVEVDLRACGFIDSTGVAVLAGTAWKLKEQERTLRLRGAGEHVRRTFELAGLARMDAVVLDP